MKVPLALLVLFLLSACLHQNEQTSTETRPKASVTLAPAVQPIQTIPVTTTSSPVVPKYKATTMPTMTSTMASTVSLRPSPSPPHNTVSFAVIGDYGTSSQGSQDVAALVNAWDPDLLLTVGDNNYPDGAAETIETNIEKNYGHFIDEQRFFPTLGNHDMTTNFGQPYLDYFTLPGNERYYDFVRGPVHFFAINSDWREVDGIGASSRQAVWLQAGLAASTTPWQVVYFHAPPYVSMAEKQVPALRWPFAAWGAELVLSGHAHLYERLTISGIPFVVNGLGGGGIYAFDAEPIPGSQIRFNDDYGALLIVATDSRLNLRFVTRAGQIIDELQLQK